VDRLRARPAGPGALGELGLDLVGDQPGERERRRRRRRGGVADVEGALGARDDEVVDEGAVAGAGRAPAPPPPPPTIAYQKRAEVDASYAETAEWLLAQGTYPRFATHDDALIDQIRNVAAREGVARDAFEFQMLYGVRPSLQDALVRDGYRLRVYVPFGDQWYPYFMRRLAERPANLVFFLRSLRDT
jgi:hypothetical protein